MKTKRRIIGMLSGTLAAVMACSSALAVSFRTTTDVNMRSRPDNSAPVVCVLPKNAETEQIGQSGKAYICAKYTTNKR